MRKDQLNLKFSEKKLIIKKVPKCLGPISNLKEQVSPDWWRRIFNSLYLKTDADVIDDKQITKKEVDLFLEILKLSLENKI